MNMTTVPSNQLKAMQQEIAEAQKTIAQQAGSIEQLRDALHLAANNMTYVGAKNWDVVANALLLQPSSEILKSRDERVAEACAKLVNRFIGGDGILNDTWVHEIEDEIRSGEWRKYL